MEQDDDVSDGEEDFHWDVVWGKGTSEADEWESSENDGDEDKETLEVN